MTYESQYHSGDQYPTVEPHGDTHLEGGADPLPLTVWDIFDVGGLYFSLVALTPPSNWELIAEGTFIISAGATFTPGSTGGSAIPDVVLNTSDTEVQSGTGDAVVVVATLDLGPSYPPYLAAYIYKRVS